MVQDERCAGRYVLPGISLRMRGAVMTLIETLLTLIAAAAAVIAVNSLLVALAVVHYCREQQANADRRDRAAEWQPIPCRKPDVSGTSAFRQVQR